MYRAAHHSGLTSGCVSNGNATLEVLGYIRPLTDLYKVDLKSFAARIYRELGGRMAPILDSIARIHDMDLWLEVVTLVIPGFNDSDEELRGIAEFLTGISPDTPRHATAFRKDYKMLGPDNTPSSTLVRGQIGRPAGLR